MMERRDVLAAGAVGAFALLPLRALAQDAAAGADEAPAQTAEEAIAAFTDGAEITDGGVTLTAPEIAENGNTVPIAFDAPDASEVMIIASGNPSPEVAVFTFGELAGSRAASTRIRLQETQDVMAIAKLADGKFGRATSNIKVTIGGCGG